MSKGDLNVDSIIEKLLLVRGNKPGKKVDLMEKEIRGLCQKAREIFMEQPIVIELEAPLKICGINISPLSHPPRRHPRPVLRPAEAV